MDTPSLVDDGQPRWGSDVVAATLRELDLAYIALTPGASFRGLHDSLVNHLGNTAPEIIVGLHEEHAVAIAHGYSKATGRPMAVALHCQVGLMHASMAIYNAWVDRAPVLLIGGNGPQDAVQRRPWIDWIHTATDQNALVRPFVKWDDQPRSASAAVESLHRAALIARTAPPGPVLVTLDATLQEAPLDGAAPVHEARRHPLATPPAPSASFVAEAARLLDGAVRPLMLIGRTGLSLSAWNQRIALAERLGAAVLTDLRAPAAFPTDHPLHAATPRLMPSSAALQLVQQADVVLSLDWIDLGGFLAQASAEGPLAAKVIQVSLEQYSCNGVFTNYFALPAVDLASLSDVDEAVDSLLRSLGPAAGRPPWHPPQPREPPAAGLVSLGQVATSLREAAAGHPVTLVRLPTDWDAAFWPFREPLDYLGYDGGAGLGSGPGMAVGAALGLLASGRLTVAILGDGDLLMGGSALWTAARYRVPLLVIVANNRSYFNDELHQERVAIQRGRNPANRWIGQRLDDPAVDLASFAETMGLVGIGPVEDPADLPQSLARAVEIVRSGRPCLVDILVTPNR